MKQLYVFLCALAPLCASAVEVLRVNEVGYLPDDVKVAVYLGETDPATVDFRMQPVSISVPRRVASIVLPPPKALHCWPPKPCVWLTMPTAVLI